MGKKVHAKVKSVKGSTKQNSTSEPISVKTLVEDDIFKKYMNDYDRDRIEAEYTKKEYDDLGIPSKVIKGPNGYECVVPKEVYTFDGVLLQKDDVIYFKKDFHECFDSVEYGIKDHNHLNYYGEPFVVEELKNSGANYIVTAKRMHGESFCDFTIHDCSVVKTSPWSKRDERCFFFKKDLPWHLLRAAVVVFLVGLLVVLISFSFGCDPTTIESTLKETFFGSNELFNMYSAVLSRVICFGLRMAFPTICLFTSVKILLKMLK